MQKGILLQGLSTSQTSNVKLRTINNAVIQLGDIDDSGKGRKFVSKFIQPGLVKIEGHGIVLLRKETLDESLPTIVGSPVIIQHKDVTEENANELRCGVIANAYFNQPDGWYYVDGIIWDEKAQELINKGWSVSCSYDFLAFNDEGGEENNIHYDKEFTQLNFTHLAIVDNPRYERANIVFNSKDEEKGKWVTIKGNHIFIPDGKTLDEVIKEKGWGDKEKNKETSKDENYKREADIALTMMAQDYEKRNNQGTVDRANELKEKLKNGEELTDKDKADIKIALEYYKDGGAEGIKEKRKKDQEKYEKEKEYYNKKQEKELEKFKKEYPIGTKFHERYFGEDREHSIQGIKLDDIDKAIIITDENGKEHHALARDITLTKEKSGLKKDKNIERNKSLLKTDLTHMLKDIDRSADYRFEDATQRLQVNDFGLWEKNEDGELQPTKETKQKVEQIKDTFKKRFNLDLDSTWSEKKLYTFSVKHKTNNSKEQDMAIIEELKKLIFKVENNKENETMVENEKVDKRKLIDEVAGIMKSAGCDDEDIRIAIGKMEKIGYDDSEASADNKKVKNEADEEDKKVDNEEDKKEEDKKVDNEEDKDEDKKEEKVDNESEADKEKVEDLKKEEKKDIDNKCKNSKEESYFDKLNKIYNSAKKIESASVDYEDKQTRLDAGKEYFG